MSTLILSIYMMKMFQEGDALKKLYLLKLLHLLPFSSANTGRILLFVALSTGKRPELNAIYGSFFGENLKLHTENWFIKKISRVRNIGTRQLL
jgi:hypothetical protein